MNGLMLKARWWATCHILPRMFDPKHRIWRYYSHLGFNTMAVACHCGEVFGAKDHLSAARILSAINSVKLRQYYHVMDSDK